jgi:hypothetical protein
MGPGTTGYEWWTTAWQYHVAYESLKEALRSDGTPFVEVSDSDIVSGALLYSDGSPRYSILFSFASEAVDDAEIIPLQNYVNAGGFLFVGSSSFDSDSLPTKNIYIDQIETVIKTYKKYGYQTLVVWEKELKDIPRLKSKLYLFDGDIK